MYRIPEHARPLGREKNARSLEISERLFSLIR